MATATKSKLNDIAAIIEATGTMRKVYRESRCPCGCGGTWGNTVSGTIGGKPAIWMGCSRRNGSAVGGGLTGNDYHVACAVLTACDRLDIDVDDVVQSEIVWDYGMRYVTGPLALDYERDALRQSVKNWNDEKWCNRNPGEYLAARRLTQRDIDIADVCDGIWEVA